MSDRSRYVIGDCLVELGKMPDQSVQCCVTSPPYWGLRDYGADGQIGLEETPEHYTDRLVAVFDEVRRVLKDDGTLWLNLGDSYAAGSRSNAGATSTIGRYHPHEDSHRATRKAPAGLKPKDLVGIPWRVAFALQSAGWYLRSDIIWAKPNPMPESVTDRPTKAHEYLFLLSRSPIYYYDAAAIKERSLSTTRPESSRNDGGRRGSDARQTKRSDDHKGGTLGWNRPELGKNKRSVWIVNSNPYPGAHFACYPPALIKPCILAGCPVGGIVLDPFFGSGTTGAVAESLGRRWIGIELNPNYEPLIRARSAQTGFEL